MSDDRRELADRLEHGWMLTHAEMRAAAAAITDLAAERDAAVAELERLREAIETHREATTANFTAKGIAPGADDLSLWALIEDDR